jgi:uncharacterized protein (TIGR03067 family)
MVKRLLMMLLLLSLSGAAALGGDDPQKAMEAELKRLEGEWQIVAAEQGGMAVASRDRVVFAGRKCTITSPKAKIVLENTITIDPAKTPRHIDVTNTMTREKWLGIYELKGDQLKAVFQGDKDGQRPTEFKTRKGSLEVMYTYERVKPK